jgi:hypothetical protein
VVRHWLPFSAQSAEERRLKEALIAVGAESPQRWKRRRPISPNVSPVVMETALVPSMKREFVMFVEIRKLERRFDKLFPFFLREG